MEEILNIKFADLLRGNDRDKNKFYAEYCGFFYKMGYDAIPFEICAGFTMPGHGALGGHKDGVIKNMDDFNRYPWEELEKYYFDYATEYFKLFTKNIPSGMKAVGGIGNGVFECVQDIVGYMKLCYIKADDEELHEKLFSKVGDMLAALWSRFLNEFGEYFCICRFGDDLGFKSDTLLSHDDIKKYIIPEYYITKPKSLVKNAGFSLLNCALKTAHNRVM
jgi:uroporphyrinogen decarboxylase